MFKITSIISGAALAALLLSGCGATPTPKAKGMIVSQKYGDRKADWYFSVGEPKGRRYKLIELNEYQAMNDPWLSKYEYGTKFIIAEGGDRRIGGLILDNWGYYKFVPNGHGSLKETHEDFYNQIYIDTLTVSCRFKDSTVKNFEIASGFTSSGSCKDIPVETK